MNRGQKTLVTAVVTLGCVGLGFVAGCYCLIPLVGLAQHPPDIGTALAWPVFSLCAVGGLAAGLLISRQMFR